MSKWSVRARWTRVQLPARPPNFLVRAAFWLLGCGVRKTCLSGFTVDAGHADNAGDPRRVNRLQFRQRVLASHADGREVRVRLKAWVFLRRSELWETHTKSW